jgi:type I restriction-modification system DNA methylase subunit
MPASKSTYDLPSPGPSPAVKEEHIEYGFIGKLQNLKYEYRADIRDRAALEMNFREKFEALNRVKLTDAEFARLLDEIVTPDVYTAAKTLRGINAFTRDDGTPLNYTLVNIKDWCKNHFEVIHQLRINTDYSHHRYDVILLINGVPCVQIELKTLGVNPRRAMEQIVDYKNDPGNGYTKTLLCFMQLFIVSNRDRTYYFANNNARHFAFNADERFLPIYEFASEDNRKVTQLDEFADHFLKKCDLGRTISRYMVLLAGEQKLMVMRPYQVYLIGQFAAGSGKKAGEFYTPQQISDILSAIVTLDSQEPKTGTKKRLESVLDFACGSGSLLLNVRKQVAKADGAIGKIFGQEKNITTYNLARMNMLLHGVKDTEFEIFHGDTLLNEWDMMREQNPARRPSFDAIVANPPFSYRWEPTDALADDVRFKSHGLAPKSAADFAFLLHGFHYLKDEGVMAIILPHGVLFRGGAEERIRTKLLKDGHIDTVIGLPANLFYSTGIPVCILVLKKCKKPDDVLFINAAEHFDKGKRQNQLKPEHIAKIINTYQFREEEARYSRRVEMAEIEKNDFNLNISRYISTAVGEAEIDLDDTHQQLVDIEKAIAAAKDKHNAFLRELGLKPLP